MLFWCFAWTGSDTNEPTERAEKTRQVSANDEEFLLFCYVLCGLCLRVLSTILMKRGGRAVLCFSKSGNLGIRGIELRSGGAPRLMPLAHRMHGLVK